MRPWCVRTGDTQRVRRRLAVQARADASLIMSLGNPGGSLDNVTFPEWDARG